MRNKLEQLQQGVTDKQTIQASAPTTVSTTTNTPEDRSNVVKIKLDAEEEAYIKRRGLDRNAFAKQKYEALQSDGRNPRNG
jgi:hypothetical protein